MRKVILLALALVFFPGLTAAETLVLVQGFLGDGDGWRDSGVTGALELAGWRDAGHLSFTRGEVRSSEPRSPEARRFYTLDLVTYAPLTSQARMLDPYIDFVRARHPYSALVLAGHSAGGVLARLYMVKHDQDPFAALITIASPHLGTPSAELGVVTGARALAWLAELLGEKTLDFHWRLFRDLGTERPGNLLAWLNHQPHPEAFYASIVHRAAARRDAVADWLVPAWSQDMNDVYALRGRARTITVNGAHGLSVADGRLLARILEQLWRV